MPGLCVWPRSLSLRTVRQAYPGHRERTGKTGLSLRWDMEVAPLLLLRLSQAGDSGEGFLSRSTNPSSWPRRPQTLPGFM